jgi:hypothetical protein
VRYYVRWEATTIIYIWILLVFHLENIFIHSFPRGMGLYFVRCTMLTNLVIAKLSVLHLHTIFPFTNNQRVYINIIRYFKRILELDLTICICSKKNTYPPLYFTKNSESPTLKKTTFELFLSHAWVTFISFFFFFFKFIEYLMYLVWVVLYVQKEFTTKRWEKHYSQLKELLAAKHGGHGVINFLFLVVSQIDI